MLPQEYSDRSQKFITNLHLVPQLIWVKLWRSSPLYPLTVRTGNISLHFFFSVWSLCYEDSQCRGRAARYLDWVQKLTTLYLQDRLHYIYLLAATKKREELSIF
jgi:hypothetical protein